jgi:hypothetical protein
VLVVECPECVVSSTLMRTLVLVVMLASCWRTEYVDRPVVRRITVYEPVPCVSVPPPEPPARPNCATLSPDDCFDLENAARSEYADQLELYIKLTVWPQCSR